MKSPVVHVRSVKNTNWLNFAEAVGIRVSGSALPASTQCPLCLQETLYIYEERNKKGQWYHCNGCKEKGHVIRLAAKIWEVEISEALERLTELGISTSSYTVASRRKENDNRIRLGTFWKFASNPEHGLKNHQVIRRYHLVADTFFSRISKILGRLYGCAHFTTIEKAVHPISTKMTGPKSIKKWSGSRIFRGYRWDNVIVLPRYDRPGRLAGFEFIGRNGDLKDRVIQPIEMFFGKAGRSTAELGLFGLNEALENGPFGTAVLAVEDTMLALRIQVRHLATANNLLPIVSWTDSPDGWSQDSWLPLFDRKVIFWHHGITPRFLRQVMQVDGYISEVKTPLLQEWYDSEHFMNYIRSTTSLDLMNTLNRNAKPWRDYMSAWTLNSNESAIIELLRGLGRLDFDLDLFARELKPKAREKILSLLIPQYKSPQQSIRFRKRIIVQKNNSWWMVNKLGSAMEQITNFTLKLERISFVGKQIKYTVVVHYQDREIRSIETNLHVHVMRKLYHLLTRNKVLGEIDQRYAKCLIDIAKGFHKPEFGPTFA